MRHLSVLTACLLVIAAQAAEPSHSAAPDAAKASAIVSIKPSIVPPKASMAAAATTASVPGAADEAETELQARIAKRIAEMRANQIARAAAAAKAKKAADARRKEAERVAALPPPPAHGTHWTYEGEDGPANWSKINVDWAACKTGTRQSPIDIRDGMKVELEAISFDYKPSSFSVVDNGHTVQVNVAGGNFITVGNHSYELVQFHFHRPSEERVNGKGYEMVVHLVHKDPEGRLAVLAVLLERGRAMQAMQTVWNNLPLEKNDVVSPSIVLDLNAILPEKREYYTYMGSLTTPPCTENVLWMVLKTPVQASPAQMAIFARLYPLNARPIQASSGRVVKESN